MSERENDIEKIRRLSEIRGEISARVAKLDKLGAKAVDMVDSIDCLLKEAEQLCNEQRLFTAFKNSLELGRSRVYELLAIRDGRKSIEDIRAATRARVAKHRASKRLTDGESVTPQTLPANVKVNAQPVRTADFNAMAQEQIAKAIQKQAGDVIDKLPTSWDTLQPSDDAQTEAVNGFHRQICKFVFIDFAPQVRAWCNATKLKDEAKDGLHDVLTQAANELMTLAQEIDRRGADAEVEAAAS